MFHMLTDFQDSRDRKMHLLCLVRLCVLPPFVTFTHTSHRTSTPNPVAKPIAKPFAKPISNPISKPIFRYCISLFPRHCCSHSGILIHSFIHSSEIS